MTLNIQEFSFRQSRDDINQSVFIFFKKRPGVSWEHYLESGGVRHEI